MHLCAKFSTKIDFLCLSLWTLHSDLILVFYLGLSRLLRAYRIEDPWDVFVFESEAAWRMLERLATVHKMRIVRTRARGCVAHAPADTRCQIAERPTLRTCNRKISSYCG